MVQARNPRYSGVVTHITQFITVSPHHVSGMKTRPISRYNNQIGTAGHRSWTAVDMIVPSKAKNIKKLKE